MSSTGFTAPPPAGINGTNAGDSLSGTGGDDDATLLIVAVVVPVVVVVVAIGGFVALRLRQGKSVLPRWQGKASSSQVTVTKKDPVTELSTTAEDVNTKSSTTAEDAI